MVAWANARSATAILLRSQTAMSQEKARHVGESEETVGNPYNLFVHMESLNEKLKLLKYENDFCRARHQKPLPRHYYAIPTNPGEQFHNFTTLAAWLIGKANGKIDPPQEYDDPNATIATILDAVRDLGYTVEFPPSKLKSGCGYHCIDVLRMLSESALKIQGQRFELPCYPEEAEDELDVDDAEFLSAPDDDICEWQGETHGGRCVGCKLLPEDSNKSPMEDDYDDDDEDDVPDLEALRNRGARSHRSSQLNELAKLNSDVDEKSICHTPTLVSALQSGATSTAGVLEATVDPSDWQLEVERVLPQLRITIRGDTKDWRAHLEEMRRHQQDIDTTYADVKTHLTRLHSELSQALNKINSREKYMNSQVEPLLSQYKLIQASQ
ncbi:intraflagellar transport protein 57 [Paragonimus westermani]|uniref:Intraflagellar transport protein 57 n=1 Tax=Paragonimus westermani TaxID=34504 RepID=A0A5J4NKN3_9TREM|nr:intraflagellar transport protein 57 [Paragonimus westermani]